MIYTNRFFETNPKPTDINLPLPIGTIMHDASGLRIITGWGMYDNQYWTETFDKDGVLWAGGRHCEAKDNDVCNLSRTIKLCLNPYITSFEKYYEKWFAKKVDKPLFEAHLNVFKERLLTISQVCTQR